MSYGYKRTLTIDHTKCGTADSANFPVLVSIVSSTFRLAANGGHLQNANAYDVAFFVDSSLGTYLPWEIDTYTEATGTLLAWVKLPTVSASVDTVFYVAYGDATVSTFQSSASSVWDSNFKGVWHLNSAGSATSADSTSNHYDVTRQGAVAATTGTVGGAANTFSSANYLSNNSLSFAAGSSITVSYWVNIATGGTGFDFSVGNSDDPSKAAGSPWVGVYYWDYGTAAAGRVSFSLTGYFDKWTHVCMSYNATGNPHVLYLDGASVASSINSTAPTTTITGVTIGGWPLNGYSAPGSIDEFRLSTSARSADWVKTEYNNQLSPSTFLTIGSEGSVSPQATISTISHLFGFFDMGDFRI